MNNECMYLTGNVYSSVIQATIQEMNCLPSAHIESVEIDFRKFVLENLQKMESVGSIIIDVSVLINSDQEVIEAIESIVFMDYPIKIIVIAADRIDGDPFLTQLMNMSVYNIVTSNDFNEIREELKYCIEKGKSYKDVVHLKEVKTQKQLEKIVQEQEVKQAVNKVLISVAGAGKRIGTTHNAIVLANNLYNAGYMVALVEVNKSGAYQKIQKSYEEKSHDNYFILNGIDYYPQADENIIGNVLGKSYNFIILDMGDYESADKITFNKSHVRMIVAGSKPWEQENLNLIFENPKDTLRGYHFCFNLTPKRDQNDVVEGMGDLKNITFLEYTEDPFISSNFVDAKKILKEYMAVKVTKKKRGLFGRKVEK